MRDRLFSNLQKCLALCGVREEDLEESFILSSGPGGQNVNKVATCVHLLHRPSGIRIKCQEERTRERNRIRARMILCERIQERKTQQAQLVRARREKLRRQQRARSRTGKEAMLAAKKVRAERKQTRRRVDVRKADVW